MITYLLFVKTNGLTYMTNTEPAGHHAAEPTGQAKAPLELIAASLRRERGRSGLSLTEVARRAGLSTSELHSLRHLAMRSMGPVDLARALGVTSAASSPACSTSSSSSRSERW